MDPQTTLPMTAAKCCPPTLNLKMRSANAWQTIKRAAESANGAHLLENITLLLEPGRSIIADAGILLDDRA